MTARTRISRTVIAALLSAAALAALLVAWFASGWGEVRARQRELEAEPATEARRTEETLARDLRLELSRVIGRENARDYYYYGNVTSGDRGGRGRGGRPGAPNRTPGAGERTGRGTAASAAQ